MVDKDDQGNVETIMNITGASNSVALQLLQALGGDVNEAIEAYFNEESGNSTHVAPTAFDHLGDDIDTDTTIPVGVRAPFLSPFPSPGNFSPFPLLDSTTSGRLFESEPVVSSSTPFVSHSKEGREKPIEVKDSGEKSDHFCLLPKIENVSGTEKHGPETHEMVIMDDDDEVFGDLANITTSYSIAPRTDDFFQYNKDLEEEMFQAAIEASEKEYLKTIGSQPGQSDVDDHELVHAISLSLKTAEQEKALHKFGNHQNMKRKTKDAGKAKGQN